MKENVNQPVLPQLVLDPLGVNGQIEIQPREIGPCRIFL